MMENIQSEETEFKADKEINVNVIIGNPYKTAICFPSKEELQHLNWRALIFAHIENRTYPMSEESEHYGRHHFFSESFELFDIGFAIFPPVDNVFADVCAAGLVAVTAVRFLLTRNRFIVLKRYALLLGTVFLFRSLTIISTILPQPQRSCMASARGNVFLDGLLILLVQKKTCTDMFFSGHATNMTFAALLWTQFSHVYPIIPLTKVDKFVFRGKPVMDHFGNLKRPTVTKIFIWLLAIMGYLFVSATRLHYMIDIIFGCFVSVCVFKLYHHALAKACMKNSLFYRFIRWFESDSPEIELGKALAENYPFLVDTDNEHLRKNSIDDGTCPSSVDPERLV